MRSFALPFAVAVALAAAPAAAQAPPAPPQAPAYGPPAYAPPAWWAPLPPAPRTERRSQGMWITGIVLFAAGGVVTNVGAGITVVQALSQCVYDAVPAGAAAPRTAARRERLGTARQALDACGGDLPVGAGILAAGLLTTVAGIPLFIIGSKRVPARPAAESLALPELRVGATGAGLKWSF